MRVPNNIRTKDTFSSATYVPTHVVTPGGGDGTVTVPTNPNPGVNPGVTTPVVYFTDTTISGNTSWTWTFYSGSTVLGTSTVQNPTYTFPAAGTYTVTLTTNQGTKTHTVVVA